MTWGIVVFPGSNCDRDCLHVLRSVLGQEVVEVWHADRTLDGVDALVLPGGFSYGDYLRPGAIAATAAIMPAVCRLAASGGPVLGICNGFQILTEVGLLPGTLMRNTGGRFVCRTVWVRVETTDTLFTAGLRVGEVLRMPIAHGDGCYLVDPSGIARLEASGRVVFRYCDAQGQVTPVSNPNGSIASIAGIANDAGNVVGLMPHPERAAEAILGSTDGRRVFESAIAALGGRATPATARMAGAAR
jgi:phosphoribosylformylglycinamidine synthase